MVCLFSLGSLYLCGKKSQTQAYFIDNIRRLGFVDGGPNLRTRKTRLLGFVHQPNLRTSA